MNKLNPKVSIIISVLNSEAVLERCIISVLNQTYKNIELIIIDGKSSDNTIMIINKYSEKINYWISEKDSGIYNAWNKAIPKSNGDWLCFIGSDDILLKETISSYVNILNPETNFICSRVRMVNENQEEIGIIGKKWNYNNFCNGLGIVHCGALHHKDLFSYGKYFDDSYKIAGDFEFLVRVGNKVRPLFLNSVTVNMFIGGVSRTRVKKVIFETSRALYESNDFGKIHGIKYFLIAHVKSIFRNFIFLFPFGKNLFELKNRLNK